MTAKILKLLPDDELRIFEAYINRNKKNDLDYIYDSLGVPEGSEEISRCSIAIAQILLHDIQEKLPSWGCVISDGEVFLSRNRHRRHQDARLSFNPKHLITLNWADSGPGFSWPEAYYVTYLPAFNIYIVTASRDGEDAFGCTDHAIGFAGGDLSELEAAKKIITENWRWQINNWDQSKWAYIFCEGLVDVATATEWANETWVELLDTDD